ncbi:MAG: response regulator [Epulopiscium sp.]|nr:response regulator [Candidatus Epulonipiscium sp.]
MFKVVIVDDEMIIAKGLQATIPWESLGCEVAGVAFNGLEAKDLIDVIRPSIVISDIVMPGMTGIELAEHIHLHHPKTNCIILTAYDDFSYAQKAVKFGVKDYILKPIDKNNVIKAIEQIVIKLKKNLSTMENIHKLENIVEQVKPLITSTLLFDIALNGNQEIQYITDQLKNFNINIGKGSVLLFQFRYKDNNRAEKLHEFAVKNIIQSLFEKYGHHYAIKKIENRYVMITRFNADISNFIIQRRLRSLCTEISSHVYEQFNSSLSIAIGGVYSNIYEIHRSYNESLLAAESYFFTQQPVIHIEQVPKVIEKYYEDVDYDVFCEAMYRGDEEKVREISTQFYNRIQITQSPTYCKDMSIMLLKQIKQKLGEKGKGWDIKAYKEFLYHASTFSELIKVMDEIFREVIKQHSIPMKETNVDIIDNAIEIIHNHYQDKNLSLQKIADQLDVSIEYLSRLFKQAMQKNFVDYVTELRIHYAKQLLLQDGWKVHEVAEKVGFYDGRYFSQVFKKRCHMSPSSYRKSSNKIK